MGEVWRAFDTVTERVVALKVLPSAPPTMRYFSSDFAARPRAMVNFSVKVIQCVARDFPADRLP
jgi:hypothetical protein